jgi:hypothetical protein
MISESSKKIATKKTRSILKTRKVKKKITVDDFFGLLPKIQDGLKFQKKVRGEWK